VNWTRCLSTLLLAFLGASTLDAQEEIVVVPPLSAPPLAPAVVASPLERFWLLPAVEVGWSRSQRVPISLVPGQSLDTGTRIGFSLTGGAWLDSEQIRGIDASVFFLEEGRRGFSLFAPSDRVLLLPLKNSGLGRGRGRGNFFALSGPEVGIGAFQALAETDYQTADLNYRRSLLRTDEYRLDALVGYRYARLSEGLHLYNKRMGGDGLLVRTKDHIHACNQFNGGQFGLTGEMQRGRWFFGGTGKLALGNICTTTLAEGAFRVNGAVDPYGFYTRPAVSGERSHSGFAVMPTMNLNVGRQITDHMRVSVSYNFQYLSQVMRPSDVFDPTPSFVGGGEGMTRDATSSDFWVQSINAGIEWRY